MQGNVKVALAVLEMIQNDMVITIQEVARLTGLHVNGPTEFLRVWAAAGWFTKERSSGHQPFIFTVTEAGRVGLSKLVEAQGQS